MLEPAKGFANKKEDKKQEDFPILSKLDSVRYELAAEANGYDWPTFRQSTLDKLAKGIDKPFAADFKRLDNWLKMVYKGPVEPILTDRVI